MVKRPVQDPFIGVFEVGGPERVQPEQSVGERLVGQPFWIDRVQVLGGQHRDHRERNGQGGEQGEANHQRQLGEHHPGHPLDEDERQEDHHGGQRAGDDGGRDLAASLDGGRLGIQAVFPQAVDVLQDHDRVIHQHADSQRQAAQGHDVQGEAGEVHQCEGGDNRDRDGDGDDGGAEDIGKENEQDEDGEAAAVEGRGTDRGDGTLDVLR
ncbi:MAG: hypothetical protein BWY73_00509 [candidate division TA06 bacterium ADurb.Bin417]|uniref:Uncharacterized protein n=1 Tax=candidate division TA06 bacterium ADurb.Bin417 TaxID=1852828 RepID=A0A1V5MIW9_UNCT6|nr:MAG: hypothetical protein BWY73_00509 [candidate division TA06 bacterium ADurb.Bin417]